MGLEHLKAFGDICKNGRHTHLDHQSVFIFSLSYSSCSQNTFLEGSQEAASDAHIFNFTHKPMRPFLMAERTRTTKNVRPRTLARSLSSAIYLTIFYGGATPGQARGGAQFDKDNETQRLTGERRTQQNWPHDLWHKAPPLGVQSSAVSPRRGWQAGGMGIFLEEGDSQDVLHFRENGREGG